MSYLYLTFAMKDQPLNVRVHGKLSYLQMHDLRRLYLEENPECGESGEQRDLLWDFIEWCYPTNHADAPKPPPASSETPAFGGGAPRDRSQS